MLMPLTSRDLVPESSNTQLCLYLRCRVCIVNMFTCHELQTTTVFSSAVPGTDSLLAQLQLLGYEPRGAPARISTGTSSTRPDISRDRRCKATCRNPRYESLLACHRSCISLPVP